MMRELAPLGMNKRNADYILKVNQRKFYPLVDHKLKTKKLLEEHNIPCPLLYFSMSHSFEIRMFEQLTHLKQFVIKPARGAAGRGILPIVDRVGDSWKTAKGELLTKENVAFHLTNILAGLYSLGGTEDEVFFEYYVRSHPIFDPISFCGVPDVRIILYQGIPIMGMLRLPTRQSGGKANLHQGAIGAGLDIVTGITSGGVHKNKMVSKHPDMGVSIEGVEIPSWKHLLEYAAKAYDIFQLGYLGIDFVIDRFLGPLVLEVNARPGLSIQLANQKSLLTRLKAVDNVTKNGSIKIPCEERVAVMKNLFGHSESHV